jgi:hypothetical protein
MLIGEFDFNQEQPYPRLKKRIVSQERVDSTTSRTGKIIPS